MQVGRFELEKTIDVCDVYAFSFGAILSVE